MSKIVRYTSEELDRIDVSDELKRIAEMPDSEIRTDLIPERRFDLKRAAERRKTGWIPGQADHKKAS
jgi:hypothetical protein